MAKRELSSNLKNLKFMQRAVQKQEKAKSDQELKPDGAFASVTTQSRKWYSLMPGWIHRRAQLRNYNVIWICILFSVFGLLYFLIWIQTKASFTASMMCAVIDNSKLIRWALK